MTNPKKKALIVGATSAIATALVEQLVREGWETVLVGRNPERIKLLANHFEIKHGKNSARPATGETPEEIWEQERTGCELLVIATGYLPAAPTQTSAEETQLTFEANALTPIEWCQIATCKATPMKHGTICVIGSVAGDRGRASNHIYGAAKAAIETYCEGLAHRLAVENKTDFLPWSGPSVCFIKPGPTRSAMTGDMAGALISQPETVAISIMGAIHKRQRVSYCPGYWAVIMAIIQNLPTWILWRTKL